MRWEEIIWLPGFWHLVEPQIKRGSGATSAQDSAVRYLIGDMPDDTRIDQETAHSVLCLRTYVVGLLKILERRCITPNPRDAFYEVLNASFQNPEIIKAITRWNRDRFIDDRGAPRVGGTRFAKDLAELIEKRCRSKRLDPNECRRVIQKRFYERGWQALVQSTRVEMQYESGGEVTKRIVSNFEVKSAWPDWAALLIDPTTFIRIYGFCHLRNAERTFNGLGIVSVSDAR